MRYVKAKYSQYRQELEYRIYITDSLYYNGENKRLTYRYAESLIPKYEDNRTGDEIALEVIEKLNLRFKE